jgi:hypothetical protein
LDDDNQMNLLLYQAKAERTLTWVLSHHDEEIGASSNDHSISPVGFSTNDGWQNQNFKEITSGDQSQIAQDERWSSTNFDHMKSVWNLSRS